MLRKIFNYYILRKQLQQYYINLIKRTISKSLIFKFVILLNILDKVLKLITLKGFYYSI
jgi:hypothetical protein